MKRFLLVILIVIIAVGLIGCSQSVVKDVTITNVTVEKERPLDYVPATLPDTDDTTWWGEQISGDITNNASKTLTVGVIIHSYGHNNENSRYSELLPIRIDPGEKKRFQYSFNYQKQGVEQPYEWMHDISDIVKK